jgi:hypothetical protein
MSLLLTITVEENLIRAKHSSLLAFTFKVLAAGHRKMQFKEQLAIRRADQHADTASRLLEQFCYTLPLTIYEV